MKSRVLFVLLTLVIAVSMVVAPVVRARSGGTSSPSLQLTTSHPPKPVREVPQEVRDLFRNGMTVEEFLQRFPGPVPRALEPFVNEPMAFIVEMEGDPLAVVYAERQAAKAPMSKAAQQEYVAALKAAQAPVVQALAKLGGTVIDQYTKAYNGILVLLPLSKRAEVLKMPGVKAVHRAPTHTIDLSASVPLINADKVWNTLGFDGTGVTVAIIDTGIDYTHAALGGSGNAADYTGNNPDVIETGTFPTAKVIGGYDFAGTKYDAGCKDTSVCSKTPTPDADPLDENGHGTHVASTVAGVGTTTMGKGVAPGAKLYALKVFGASGSTNLVQSAIEWAMDPNGDGDISDHVDVINMSLGASYGPNDPADPELVAVNNASAIGVVVVASAGNSGNTSYIVGSPSVADSVISVAASTTGYATGPTVSVAGSTLITQTNLLYQPPAFDNNTGHFTQTITATLFYVGNVITDTLCTTGSLPTTTLQGKIALIQRGDCAFTTKVNNAASLGAVGALIFNHSSGGNSRVTMAGSPVNIPAGFLAHDDGANLVPAHGQTVVVSAETQVTTVKDQYTPADTVASFSSRGPRGFDSILKPDVTAPGVAIFAAKMGSGDQGVSYSGTSMAAPHVAGVAALLKQAHPGWTPEQIKAAMMNTAHDLVDRSPVVRQGAGRVDVLAAANAPALAIGDRSLVSLNWGVVPLTSDSPYSSQKSIQVQNLTTSTVTYTVGWMFGPGSSTSGVSLSLPPQVVVNKAPSSAVVPVTLHIDPTAVSNGFRTLEEYMGYVVFTNTATISDVLRVPFYVMPQPYSHLAQGTITGTMESKTVDFYHSGPITSSLWAYPAFAYDANQSGVGDEADLRMVGMDYGWTSGTYGPVFTAAFNVWGSWHTPQPYFAEFDLYLDVDQDGASDLVNFNYNYGWYSGGDHNDTWVVIQLDLHTNTLSLGSPYLIYTDYNTGFQEWYLPAAWNGLGSGDTDFNFKVYSFDYNGNYDFVGTFTFDYAHPPFSLAWGSDPGPSSPMTTVKASITDLYGYSKSMPVGIMVVDYQGEPGVGQAYYVKFPPVYYKFFPVINAP